VTLIYRALLHTFTAQNATAGRRHMVRALEGRKEGSIAHHLGETGRSFNRRAAAPNVASGARQATFCCCKPASAISNLGGKRDDAAAYRHGC